LEKSHSSHKSQSGRLRADAGFSLVEVMIATGILAAALVSLAQLFAISTASNHAARNSGTAMIYAEQKIEQLRALSYTLDASGLPITDSTTDTSVYPPAVTGGTGLSPSTDNTLQSNTDGYVDYLDTLGRSLGGGETIPDNTAFIRRWSIEPLPTNPNNVIIMQVLVTRSRDRGTGDLGSVARGADEARLMTIRSRKVQ
jgi:prepilin-type N-terminal cleavage/methylation domain-containing protein